MPSLLPDDDVDLSSLRSYQYRSIDNSPISRHVLSHYWNWAIQWFPLWMAPNLITLIGLSFMILAVGLIMWLVPDLESQGPNWLYFVCAGCLWLYSTFDNVDGKQARRTGSSSPLGELFDHGCDALNCGLGVIVQAASLGVGFGWRLGVLMGLVFWAFYLPTWEEYHTGILHLGHINGPTEGIIMACAVMMITGWKGVSFWWHPILPYDFCLIDLMTALISATFFLYYLPSALLTVSRKTRISYACLQLIPMALLSVAFASWMWSPNSTIISDSLLACTFILNVGLVFGKMATKIILAHLLKRPFPYGTAILWPMILGSTCINLGYLLPYEPLLVYSYFAFSLLAYCWWAVDTINRFCAYLDINCLTLKKRKKEGKSLASKANTNTMQVVY